jgi:hypothetical protein
LGNRVRQPNLNFAPQLGFAWDPSGRGKAAIRGGIGLFYENVLTVVVPTEPAWRTPSTMSLSACRAFIEDMINLAVALVSCCARHIST